MLYVYIYIYNIHEYHIISLWVCIPRIDICVTTCHRETPLSRGLALYDVLPLLPLISATGLGVLVLLLYVAAYCSGWDVISLVEPETAEQ